MQMGVILLDLGEVGHFVVSDIIDYHFLISVLQV